MYIYTSFLHVLNELDLCRHEILFDLYLRMAFFAYRMSFVTIKLLNVSITMPIMSRSN